MKPSLKEKVKKAIKAFRLRQEASTTGTMAVATGGVQVGGDAASTPFAFSKRGARPDTIKQGGYSLSSHATHIFISSLASTFYLISHGFTNWYVSIGNVFVLLIIAVVVPCTLADVVVPMTMARLGKKPKSCCG